MWFQAASQLRAVAQEGPGNLKLGAALAHGALPLCGAITRTQASYTRAPHPGCSLREQIFIIKKKKKKCTFIIVPLENPEQQGEEIAHNSTPSDSVS